jgi:hypothetical protein
LRVTKNQQFLDRPVGLGYDFQNNAQLGSRFSSAACDPLLRRLTAGNDSEMALQAVEIAQNGLGNGNPPARLAPGLSGGGISNLYSEIWSLT